MTILLKRSTTPHKGRYAKARNYTTKAKQPHRAQIRRSGAVQRENRRKDEIMKRFVFAETDLTEIPNSCAECPYSYNYDDDIGEYGLCALKMKVGYFTTEDCPLIELNEASPNDDPNAALEIADLKAENELLKKESVTLCERCYVLSSGQLCNFCALKTVKCPHKKNGGENDVRNSD